MKEYTPKRAKYILPGNMYLQTLLYIRDYHHLKVAAEELLLESPPPPDGQPKGSGIGNPVERTAQRREHNLRIIRTIERARDHIPEEYRAGVWHNLVDRKRFPSDADRTTYARYKSRMVYEIARELFYLD